jgi:hypothetical protein
MFAVSIALSGGARPEHELEILILHAHAQEARTAGCWVLAPLLQPDDVRIEIERLILVTDEHGRIDDFL